MPATAALAALLCALGLLYAWRCGKLGTVNDLWFGSDVWRHVEWAASPAERGRSALHPGTFLLFKAHGALLRVLGLSPPRNWVVGHSLPVILLASAAAVGAAALLARGRAGARARWEVLLLLVAIGPLLVFGPMAESHVPGGAALLVQAALVLAVLRGRGRGAPREALRRQRWSAAAMGLVAVSATVTNVLPALVLLTPLWGARRTLGVAAGFGAAVGLAAAALHLAGVRLGLTETALQVVRYELSVLPSFEPIQAWWSFRGLVLHQFGMALTELTTWTHPADGAIVTNLHDKEPTLLQLASFGLWCAGLVLWARDPRAPAAERSLVRSALLALGALVVFHSVASSYEAYIFSAHAWPYVAVPAAVVWLSPGRVARRCIAAAAVLALLQTLMGILWLVHLPGELGARWE